MIMGIKPLKRISKLAILILVIANCGSIRSIDVKQAYSEKARELGLFPVYPPREEFQIGDIYLVSSAKNNRNDSVSVWLGSVDGLQKEATKFLESRVVFRETATEKLSTFNKTGAGPQADTFGTAIATRKSQYVESLPLAAFPSISANAGFTAGVGIVGALQSLGIGFGRKTTVTLDFVDVRTYWVPKVLAAPYKDAAGFKAIDNINQGLSDLTRLVKLKKGSRLDAAGGERCLTMALVTRVYLTRRIDYTYRDAQILAAGIRRADVAGTLQNVAPAPTVIVNQQQGDGGTGETLIDDAQLNQLRQSVAAVQGQTSAGQSLAFQSWDARGLRFGQTFQRPVAIGWDGFDFEFTFDPNHKPSSAQKTIIERSCK